MKKWLCLALLGALVMTASAKVHIRISKNDMSLSVLDDDRLLARYPIACGKVRGQKQQRGDMRTPEGKFTVIEVQDSRLWRHDFGDGKGLIKGAYGPWFFRLSAGNGIGIHGTHDPESICERVTEGCVRMLNEDLEEVKGFVYVGMEVEILPDGPLQWVQQMLPDNNLRQ